MMNLKKLNSTEKVNHLFDYGVNNFKNLDYDYKSLGKDFSAEEMFELFPNAKTFPQIKIDGKSIGGYDQLVLHLN